MQYIHRFFGIIGAIYQPFLALCLILINLEK